jgi:hypothetical protein
MIRDKKTNRGGPIVVDLTGPQGNAFFLLGMAQDLGRQLKFDKETRDLVTKQMQESDYENLIRVFDKYFGDFVILER